MPTSIKRSVQIKVTLSADLHNRLGQLAAELGQAPATLCSIWIGERVRALEVQTGAARHAVEHAIERMVPAMERQLGEQMRLVEAAAEAQDPPASNRGVKSASKPRRAPSKGGKA